MREQYQARDGRPAVTAAVPGGTCDVQLRVTVTGRIDYTFTLFFRGGAIAVLRIHGAESADEACAYAASVLPNMAYEVVDGDTTNGHVAPFHAWTDAEAQERTALLLRDRAEQETAEPPRKEPSELTDAKLEQMCNEIEAIIEGLSAMDPKTLTKQADQERQQYLNAALDLGEVLVLEQIRRLVARVQRRVREMKAQAAQGLHQQGEESQ